MAVLVTPFLLIDNPFASLALALGLVSLFSFYVSVVRDFSFRRRFLEMAVISLGVAGLSFGVGVLVRIAFDAEV